MKKRKLPKSVDLAEVLQEQFIQLDQGNGNVDKAESLRKTALGIVKIYSSTKKEQEKSKKSKVSKKVKDFFDIA